MKSLVTHFKRSSKIVSGAFLAALLMIGLCAAGQEPSSQHRLAAGMQRKLDHIRQNAALDQPDQTPTVITEDEINDYFAAGMVKLPQGVKKVTFQGQSGTVTGLATVDFDEIRAGVRSSNPLLSFFNGTHDIRVEADASGAGGKGKVHVNGVWIDGVEIPRIALEVFAQKFITPKYPNVGIDSEFNLSDKIDIAEVGYHKLTITQK